MGRSNILILRNKREYKCVDLNLLLYICVDNYLCDFYLENKQKFTCTKSLNELESKLPKNFFRINRDCMENIFAIDTVRADNRTITLSNSVKFVVSFRRIKQLLYTLTDHITTYTG
jgi:DNA-binding LytR/AlgR family response regulator